MNFKLKLQQEPKETRDFLMNVRPVLLEREQLIVWTCKIYE